MHTERGPLHKCYIASGDTSLRLLVRGPVENANTNGRQNTSDDAAAAQMLDFPYGEGRCPVVPLVFKTSLGAVRSPEGSTPSLLRQVPGKGVVLPVDRLGSQTSGRIPH